MSFFHLRVILAIHISEWVESGPGHSKSTMQVRLPWNVAKLTFAMPLKNQDRQTTLFKTIFQKRSFLRCLLSSIEEMNVISIEFSLQL